jgi:hypothetical protein
MSVPMGIGPWQVSNWENKHTLLAIVLGTIGAAQALASFEPQRANLLHAVVGCLIPFAGYLGGTSGQVSFQRKVKPT